MTQIPARRCDVAGVTGHDVDPRWSTGSRCRRPSQNPLHAQTDGRRGGAAAAATMSVGGAWLEAARAVTLGRLVPGEIERSVWTRRRRRFGGGGVTVAGGWTVSPHAGTLSGSPLQTGRSGGPDIERCSATTTTMGHAHGIPYGRHRCPDDGDETHRGRRRIP